WCSRDNDRNLSPKILQFVKVYSRARDSLPEISRQWSFKTLPFTAARMTKTQFPCVQHLARKIFSKSRRIDFIAQNRMAQMMKMHPNLMCAATVQFAFNQTRLLT